MNYIKKYKVFESETDPTEISVRKTISTIRTITTFMEEDVRKACESMGMWDMNTLKFSFSGFNNPGHGGEWDFKDQTDEEMAEDVIRYEFPLMDEKTETGFGINIELSDEYCKKNNLDINNLSRSGAETMYMRHKNSNSNAGSGDPYNHLELDEEVATLHFSFLNLDGGKKLRDILNKKYDIADVEENDSGIWLSVEFNLKDYFDRSKNLFLDINK